MASRKLRSPSSRLTLGERVNIAEGEDELSDSDGLDMVKGSDDKPISFDEYINSVDAVNEVIEVSSGNDDGMASEQDVSFKRKRKTSAKAEGERVYFDDAEDPDTAYQDFTKRKTVAKKQAAAENKRAKAKVAAKDSMVGRKPKTVIAVKEKRKRKVGGDSLSTDDDDEVSMETTLPAYLKQRRSSWDQRRAEMGTAGLQIPPSYDDVDFSDDERIESLVERPRLVNQKPTFPYEDVELRYSMGIIPAPIAQWLRPYQVAGAEFMHELFVYQKGGILGDDMGLGKTIQVIAFLTAAFGKTGDERDHKRMRKMRRMADDRWYPRVLVICPCGLMLNWKSELERWGWWQIYTYHGTPTSREEALAAAQKGRLEIMITTYNTYRLNQSAINGIRWDCVVADECHIIKERGSEITKSMNEVNALCRIGLSGTVIQNKYEELWTILNWTNPGAFGPISNWKQAIAIPLKLGQSHDATVSQLARSRRTAEKLVKNLLPRFMLRRTKDLIKDELPKKSDMVVFCPLTETQSAAYNNFCDSEIVRACRDAQEPCTCGSGKKQGYCCYAEVEGKKWQHFVFPCLVTLQKLSNHVALLIPGSESDREKHDKELEKLETALPDLWRDLYAQRDSIMNYANTLFCGKWRVLKKLLRLWHGGGDKVLVFSHSVRLLKMLALLFKTTTAYNVSYLDGSMSYADRQQTVDDFNSDPAQFVFLISTKAGGVGLNITSANKVVVVDPNWNPAYDLQAQDRAYRIGQTRDVEVFRLVSAGTVEEIVYARQIYKQQQARIGYEASVERRYFTGVQDAREQKGEIFGLANLFAPGRENVVLRDIVNKTNVAETRAGVEIAGLDLEASQASSDGLDDGEDSSPLLDERKEDAAMSQLAQDIIDEPGSRRRAANKAAKKRDAVQAILASVGVEYTHENAEVVGTSKIETKISRRAQKSGNDVDLDREYAFARSQASQSYQRPSFGEDGLEEVDEEGREKVVYRYRPPEDVRRRQFCSMAEAFGYGDMVEFALVVEGWTQGQRREGLERFYAGRRKVLAGSGSGSPSAGAC